MSAQNLLYLTIYNPTLPTMMKMQKNKAHILFYTSKDRAVSRDRMLRQVGLAKALVSFAEMFNLEQPCSNVHSQSRKNDHGFELILFTAYEKFKLLHGSFSQILATLGQQALELQLERFFTVWAWSWNLEDGYNFGDHLAAPLHPLHRDVLSELDAFSSEISQTAAAIVVTPNHIIPSSRYLDARYPSALPPYLMTFLVPPQETPRPPSSSLDDTVKQKRPPDPSADSDSAKTFLSMPSVDVGKWNWPGYLTFGKSPGKKPSRQSLDVVSNGTMPERAQPQMDAQFDQSALEDAMFDQTPPVLNPTLNHSNTLEDGHIPHSDSASDSSSEFSSLILHLSETNTILTRKTKVFYLTSYPLLLALVDLDEEDITSQNAQIGLDALADIHKALHPDRLMSTPDIPSANKILQPKDQSVISTGQYSISEAKFSSKSVHMFNTQQLLESDVEIQEVFSRGQSPQHWHVARRGLNVRESDGQAYMEVFRNEASLTDVDNSLGGIIRGLQ
ncbi:hypothetical protein C8J56DRAFT_979519 [Mycena floridula]|nr:hypothetical protein C8J56DRAFT_979519 [Mycena floridula]